MNPEERALLERNVKLAEENNKILRGMQRGARLGAVWSFVKFMIVAVPLIIGYWYLEPYLGSFAKTFKQAQSVLNGNFSQPQ